MYAELKGKRLLILGGNLWKESIKQVADTYGITLIATGNDTSAGIFEIADECYNIDSTNSEAMKKLILEKNIDGVYMGGSETVISAACEYLAELNTEQDAITKDNVTVKINAVIYYNIFDAKKAVLSVENYHYAVTQLAQTTMRNIVGSVTLDELLGDREKISNEICSIVDKATDEWGVKIQNVELKDIALPTDMQRVIAKVAEAEREKLAVITKSRGELEASENLAKAATELSNAPGALHLRTLSTINDVSSDQSNTIIFAIPLEILRSFGGDTNTTKKIVDVVKKTKK